MYLELVWIEDQAELKAFLAKQPDTIPIGETWQTTGYCPFGVGLHYRTPNTTPMSFETRRHTAQWMPADSLLELFSQPSLYVPPCSILHGSLAYWENRFEHPHGHPLGVQQLTDFQITVTSIDAVPPTHPLLSLLPLKLGDYPLLELTVDAQRQGKVFDMRPLLPLRLYC
ncbi:hypothetical protein [Herpetosiphon geysericola]|uniref:Glyoxalase-like domain-containing protein n=1 Tax=Herpetosiphon geysericola TaxID=70996 RepID=A0A0P6Z0M5_9CHLR|nr:hypothetical protein [Herpetosiphon geysericola]KPL90900.1 hypothetical protein SE18_03725 [Herpetosiphon geysericola]